MSFPFFSSLPGQPPALRGSEELPCRSDPPRGVTRGIDPDFQKFDRALKTQLRPVLVSLQLLPFRDFTAEEFLGRTLTIGAGGGFFREAVSLSARWLMRAFMLAGAPTSIRKSPLPLGEG